MHAKSTGVYGTFTLTKDLNDYTQAGNLYRIFSEDEKARLVATIAGSLSQTSLDVQQRMIEHFTKADADYGQRIKQALAR